MSRGFRKRLPMPATYLLKESDVLPSLDDPKLDRNGLYVHGDTVHYLADRKGWRTIRATQSPDNEAEYWVFYIEEISLDVGRKKSLSTWIKPNILFDMTPGTRDYEVEFTFRNRIFYVTLRLTIYERDSLDEMNVKLTVVGTRGANRHPPHIQSFRVTCVIYTNPDHHVPHLDGMQ